MLTVYLDQNKWIDLAKALYRSDVTTADSENAESLKHAVGAGRLRFPISELHLMEAYRIGNGEQRFQLASVFATFSAGWFIASRHVRLSRELDAAVRSLLSPAETEHQPCFNAFAQDMLWAFGDTSHLSSVTSISAERIDRIFSCSEPMASLFRFVAVNDESVRRVAIERMTASNNDLMGRIRSRRERTRSETAEIRFRAYSAQLFLEEQDKINAALVRAGKSFQDLRVLPNQKSKRLPTTVSTITLVLPMLEG